MRIPFTSDEFLGVFAAYNQAVWPLPLIFAIAAILSVLIVLKNDTRSQWIVPGLLSVLWVWMGVVYHLTFFTSINPAAYVFGSVFILQGLLFLFAGLFRKSIRFRFEMKWTNVVALFVLAYGLILYPLIGYWSGRAYPHMPTFGVPCPTTIFTFGVLLLSVNRVPWYLIIIPCLWSVIGFTAALKLSITEDYGLLISCLVAIPLLILKPRPLPAESQ